MNPNDLYKAAKLQDAIAALTQEVKSHPADQNLRLFLFELLTFAGDLDRARRQLELLKYNEIELETAAQGYRKLLDAEVKRRGLFAQSLAPSFLIDPPAHVELRLQAIGCLRQKQYHEATQLLEQANQAPGSHPPGKLNGKPFDLLRDCDDLFGPVLEVMAHGNYYWLPVEQVETLTMKAPQYPRDLLWVPARLEMKTSAGDVFLPALYPGTYEHPKDEIKLGRETDWQAAEGGPTLGAGHRMYLAGDDGISILDFRELQMNP